jgi:SAM-dependent methyltransferase
MARELTYRGYKVVGLDGSEEMIGFARTNAPEALLFLADARGFSTTQCFDAVLSTFNSFAHASTISELEAIFRNVRAALKPDALFLFDISMEEAYTSKWRGSFGDVQEDVAWIVRPTYDAETKLARNDVTIFHRSSSYWHRTNLSISQRCFSEHEIRAALSAAGFHEVNSYDAERDLAMQKEAGRRFYVCN